MERMEPWNSLIVELLRTTLLLEKHRFPNGPTRSQDGVAEFSGKRRGMQTILFNDRSGKQTSKISNWRLMISRPTVFRDLDESCGAQVERLLVVLSPDVIV